MRWWLVTILCAVCWSCEQATEPEVDSLAQEVARLSLTVDSLRAEMSGSDSTTLISLQRSVALLTWELQRLREELRNADGVDGELSPPVVISFSAISGDGQQAGVNQPFVNNLAVVVSPGDLRGFVTFEVIEGDASIVGAASETDRDGIAMASLVAGSTPGAIVVRATLHDGSEVLFHLSVVDVVLPPPTYVYEPLLIDDFDDGAIEPDMWTSFVSTGDGTIEERDGELWMDLTPLSMKSAVNATSSWLFVGEFDVQIDFTLHRWHPESSVRVGLKAGAYNDDGVTDAVIRLHDGAWGEVYVTHLSDGARGRQLTSDLIGKLRLIRVGQSMSGLRWTPQGWSIVHTGTASMDNGPLILSVWASRYSPGATVSFDNVIVNRGTMQPVLTPPTPSEQWRRYF